MNDYDRAFIEGFLKEAQNPYYGYGSPIRGAGSAGGGGMVPVRPPIVPTPVITPGPEGFSSKTIPAPAGPPSSAVGTVPPIPQGPTVGPPTPVAPPIPAPAAPQGAPPAMANLVSVGQAQANAGGAVPQPSSWGNTKVLSGSLPGRGTR